jgi:uncharacterized membrane protein YeiH
VAWLRDPYYLTNAVAAALGAFFVSRLFETLRRELLIADAFALALFTIIGTRKAVAFQVAPPVAIALGVVTGVAGGILRDVLTGEIPLVFRPQIYLYATAALAGATVFIVLAHFSVGERRNMLASTGVILLLRLFAIRWKVKLPVYESGDELNE